MALAAMTVASSAATISVNFNETTTGTHANQQIEATTAAGLTGFVAQNWNNVGGSGSTVNSLVQDVAGTASTSSASVTWSSNGVWGDGNANTDATAGVGDAQVARGYLDDGGSGVNFDVTGISYASYTVVLYYSGDQNGGSWIDATVNGTTSGPVGAKRRYVNPNWDATNTVVFTGLSGDLSVDIAATTGNGAGGTARGSLGGFQIIETTAVPEPSSTALLGLGGLALILRRRK